MYGPIELVLIVPGNDAVCVSDYEYSPFRWIHDSLPHYPDNMWHRTPANTGQHWLALVQQQPDTEWY